MYFMVPKSIDKVGLVYLEYNRRETREGRMGKRSQTLDMNGSHSRGRRRGGEKLRRGEKLT